jgi:hypothetical protein
MRSILTRLPNGQVFPVVTSNNRGSRIEPAPGGDIIRG